MSPCSGSIPPMVNGEHQIAMSKLPPHAVEAEMALIGCILADPSCLPKVRPVVPQGSWMMRPRNGTLYDNILAVADANQGAVDIVLLNQRLEDNGELKLAGGLNYLVELASAFPSAAHAIHYAKLVRDKHLVFVALAVGGDLMCALHNRPDEFRLHIGDALAKLMEIQRLAE